MTEQIRPLESLTKEDLIELIRQEREAIGAGGVSLMSDAKGAEIALLREAMQGLLDAMPSATTHPAIKAARAALAQEQEGVMGIIKREIIEYTCDLCGSPTDEHGCEIAVEVSPGDGRDVGPSVLRGAITLYEPYGVANGVVCHPCKIKWLRKYLEIAA